MHSALETRRGPVLSDGVALRDLIDFNRRTVSARVLSDREIHRLELKRIFARSWISLAHEAEIPNAGDFVQRHIGDDAVLVTRDRDGEINILLNACSHRGMEICWADQGNQPSFQCPYHGWVFDSAGKLMGAPYEREMYGDWDRSQYGLMKARIAVRHGRIFGNFSDAAPSLDDWLGDAACYLDQPYEQGDPEMEVCLAPRRFRVPANWKLPADSNSGDTAHGVSLHRSLTELGVSPGDPAATLDTLKVSSAMGHGLAGFDRRKLAGGDSADADSRYAFDNFTFTSVLFPASFGIGGSSVARLPGPDGRLYLVVDIGGVVPRGPDAFEMWAGRLVEKAAPEPIKAMLGKDKPADWPGPRQVFVGPGQDDDRWNWWMRWFDLMTADEADADAETGVRPQAGATA